MGSPTADVAMQDRTPSRRSIDPMKIITMIQSKRHIKMAGPDKLRIVLKYGDLQQRVLAIRNFFGELK